MTRLYKPSNSLFSKQLITTNNHAYIWSINKETAKINKVFQFNRDPKFNYSNNSNLVATFVINQKVNVFFEGVGFCKPTIKNFKRKAGTLTANVMLVKKNKMAIYNVPIQSLIYKIK